MLNVSGLKDGIVLDHIKAGTSMSIFNLLHLDRYDCQVAMIRNVKSCKMGKKDIIKIEAGLDTVDLDVLGYIDHNITVNIIKDQHIVDKKKLTMPNRLVNVLFCKNPRCITSTEKLPHVFLLTDPERQVYRCQYCETSAQS